MDGTYLSHHGIKGQKWGVRRFQTKSGDLTAAGKKRRKETSDEQKKSEEDTKPKRKSVTEMSDDELRQAINRIRMEQDYKALTGEPAPKKIVDGRKLMSDVANKVLIEPGVRAASNAVSKHLEKAVNESINGKPKTTKQLKEAAEKGKLDKLSNDELKKLAQRLGDEKKIKDLREGKSSGSNMSRDDIIDLIKETMKEEKE